MTGSPADMVNSAKVAGFTGGSLVAITAIGLAESGGVENLVSGPNSDGSRDYGYFQINDKAHPQYNTTQLLNGVYNAQAAYAISNKGTDFSPWTTWTSATGQKDKHHNESALKPSTLQQAEDLIGLSPTARKQTVIPLVPNDPRYPNPDIINAPPPGDPMVRNLTGSIGSVGDAVKAIGTALAKLSDRNTWVRVGEYFAGFILLLIGLGLVFRRDFVSGAKTAIGAV